MISLAQTPSVHDTPGKSLLHEGIRFQAACRLQAGMRHWHVHSKILPAKLGQGIAQVQVVLQTTGLKGVVPSHGPRNLFLNFPQGPIAGVAMLRLVEVKSQCEYTLEVSATSLNSDASKLVLWPALPLLAFIGS